MPSSTPANMFRTKFFLLIVLASFVYACNSGSAGPTDKDRLVAKWQFQTEYLGVVEYMADGTALATTDRVHNYNWEMDASTNTLVTTDDFGTTTFNYQFMGNDTLTLKIDNLIDKYGNEMSGLLGKSFMLFRASHQ